MPYENNWITVGGIRSTGLTAAPGIGEYVGEMYNKMINPGSYGRSGGARLYETLGQGGVVEGKLRAVTDAALGNSDSRKLGKYSATPLRFQCERVPGFGVLARDYKKRGDGKVQVYGKEWVVSHPVASFGLQGYDGKDSTS